MAEQETTDTAVEETPGEAAQAEVPGRVAEHVGDSEAAHHPPPSAYVAVAMILAIVTAAEVGLYYVTDVDDWLITVSLLVLMAIKFFLVAMWFMHLRFETLIFRRLFYGGLFLATAVFAVVLGASHVFPFFV